MSTAYADGPRFLSVAQAAALVSLSTKTIYALIDKGEIPAVRIGAQLRIPIRWCDELLKAGENAHAKAGGAE